MIILRLFIGEIMNLIPIVSFIIGLLLGKINNWVIEKLSEEAEIKRSFVFSIYLLTVLSVFAAVYYSERAIADIVFASFLIIVGGVDHLTKSIVVFTIYVGGILSAALSLYYGMPLIEVVIGGVVGFALYLAIYWVAKLYYKKEAFGFGDVMFMGAIGVFLGPWFTLLSSLLTFYVALVFVVIQKIIGKLLSRQSEIAFAPYMAVAAWLTSLFGAQIVELYLILFMV